MARFLLLAATLFLSVPTVVRAETAPGAVTPDEARLIATEAYVYLYPLITMDVTRRQATNVSDHSGTGRAPANTFAHVRHFPDASFRDVVRPNFDTLYSSAWIDLTKGPAVISVPDTKGRYYLLPMIDMWSDVFAVPGRRTTGTGAGEFALVPPGWTGTLPAGTTRIDAPTPYVWIIGRTQTNGPADYAAVNAVQDGYTVKPAAGSTNPAPSADIDMKTPPLAQVNGMPALDYFRYGAELMAVNPPHATDWSLLQRMRRIGLEPGKFDAGRLSPEVRAAIEQAARDGLKNMHDKLPTLARVTGGWQMNTDTMGVYGNYYLKRAIIALVGLGANQPDDAIYPLLLADADGAPLQGDRNYVLHFDKAQLPPVDAFWSLTMYDAEGFQVANSIDRFAIGDRDKLVYNADGSLDLYIQHASPGKERENNWLPAPANGTLGLTMRLYAPRAEALDGRWNPPPVKRVP